MVEAPDHPPPAPRRGSKDYAEEDSEEDSDTGASKPRPKNLRGPPRKGRGQGSDDSDFECDI